MKAFIFRTAILISLASASLNIFAIQGYPDNGNLNIPQEILDRLPEEQIAPFILGRKNIISSIEDINSNVSFYEEINVSQNTIARVPDDQLFDFLADLGYIEDVSTPENPEIVHIENSPPSPEQLIQLLFWLIGGVLLIILTFIYLAHKRRMGEQEVVLRALEVGEEIPLSLFEVRRQKSFLRWGILFLTIAGALLLYGIFNHASTGIFVIPASLGTGLLLAGILVKD